MLPAEERVLYDLVIIDTTDWSLGGEWSLDFYVMLSFLMTPRSLVVANLDTPLLTSSAVMPAVGGLRTVFQHVDLYMLCLLYTSPSPRDQRGSRMPSSA